jgi:gamma-F420-2:alpha-L-glutamate ligase
MEVWILFDEEVGASSSEAFEVRRFIEEGEKSGITVKVFQPEQFDILVTAQDRHAVLINGELVPLPDFVLPRTYVIRNGYFALAVIRQLERLGVRVFNNSSSIENVADKLHTHQILLESSLPTPTTMLAKFPIDIALVERVIGFPVVVKTLQGVNGEGVFLLEDNKSFQDFIDLVSQVNPNVQMIFQEFIANSKGRDLRLFVVDGDVVASMERRALDDGFKANYSQGAAVQEFKPDEAAVNMAVRTASLLNLQVAGIDLLYAEDGGYTICEANSFPGFKGLESCCDVNIPQEIFKAMRRILDSSKEPPPEVLDEPVVDSSELL